MAFRIPIRKEPLLIADVIETMRYERVIERAVQDVQDLLRTQLLPKRPLPYHRVVACLRTVVGAPEVQRAIEQGNDTALIFVLRGINSVLNNSRVAPDAILSMLWDIILDRTEVQENLAPRSARMFLRKKPPA
jgi:hypothetical protein